jgi:hypothetical protein
MHEFVALVPDLVPEVFAAASQWTEEKRGTRPTLRAPWALPGWRGEAEE